MAGPGGVGHHGRMGTSWRFGPASVAIAAAAVLVGCASAPSPGSGTPPSAVASSSPAAEPAPSATTSGTVSPSELARCAELLEVTTVRGLLGGTPEVTGGKQRVTGQVTQTRCTWFAPNGRYITIVSLDGPGLPARARTVTAGAKPVAGSPGVSYDVTRGLIVTVDERLHQIVAGGAGTAQARVIGLKVVDAIRGGG